MSITIFIISWIAVVLLTAVGIVVIKSRQHKNRLFNYSCAEAQLDMKNAQRKAHRRMRSDANKILLDVLEFIRSEANNRKPECAVDMEDMERKHKFNPAEAVHRRNAVKDSLRNKGFLIIPGACDKAHIVRISWQTSRTDKEV